MSNMKLIVGLGNPGEKYERNRHNAGFVVVDKILRQAQDAWQLSDWKDSKKFLGAVSVGKEVILLKPSTFMNDSGRAVSQIAHFYKVKHEDTYIIYDDLDIVLGEYKIQHSKGPKIHNGLTSVREQMATNAFWHVRMGVENRSIKGNGGIPGVEYSLQNFAPEEQKIFDKTVQLTVSDIMQRLTL